MSLTNHVISNIVTKNGVDTMILKAPHTDEIKFFNEPPNGEFPACIQLSESIVFVRDAPEQMFEEDALNLSPPSVTTSFKGSRLKKLGALVKPKKSVTFPENVVRDYSAPPRLGWVPGTYPTSDLLEAYLRSCERHKCRSIQKLVLQLKALQDLDCSNGEKVNYLNLKNERIDARQIETLEEIFKRLSFKAIDLEHTTFEDETCTATLFEILGYYDTVEKLIISNSRTTINLMGWQELSKFIRKGVSLEYLDIQGHTFNELIYFTYLARSIKLTTTLRVLHLEHSNISGRYLIMLAAALKDNEQIKELYLGDNKIQPSDGNPIAAMIKENTCLDILDLRNNSLQDTGLSHICSGLSEQHDIHSGLKALVVMNNNITASGISYLSKALIHNRSLSTLNIAHNTLTNEAIYELKEALIVNKQITSLFLNKTKLSDEGVIALAEYIAETSSLNRLDLRDNDIRLGGLMALVSSLKFNNTLSRLDVDKEPKKEHTFFNITFQMKDSLETSRRLFQDLNDYCLRNQRTQAVLEAERAEKAKEQAEERRKLQIENERQLLELVKEINTQVGEYLVEGNDENESMMLSPTTRGENMDELLDKIIVNTSSQGSGHAADRKFSGIDQFNFNHCGLITDSFQLVDGVELESSETDPDMVIFGGPKLSESDVTNSSLNVEAGSLSTTLTEEEELFEMEILSVANSLVEKTVWNLKQQEPRTIRLMHQNSTSLMFESMEEQVVGGGVGLQAETDHSEFSNFDDSNDLSTSIEPVTGQGIEESSAVQPNFSLSTNENPTESKSINDSSLLEEESCNDSDIEVLEVSTRQLINKMITATSLKFSDSMDNRNHSGVLLTLIDELDVHSLGFNGCKAATSPDANQKDIDCSDENYDSVNTNNNLEDQKDIETAFRIHEIEAKSTPIRPTKPKATSQTEPTSSSDTSLILSTSPLNQFSPKFFNTELSPPDGELAKSTKNSQTSSQIGLGDEQPTRLLELTESVILPVAAIDGNFTKPIDRASDNRPFFASKMTDSQISEELSNEIGFKRES